MFVIILKKHFAKIDKYLCVFFHDTIKCVNVAFAYLGF